MMMEQAENRYINPNLKDDSDLQNSINTNSEVLSDDNRKSRSFYYLQVVVIVVGFLLFGFGGYILGIKSTCMNSVKDESRNKEQLAINSDELSNDGVESKMTPTTDKIPKKNVLYYGIYNGQDAFFLSNERLNVYFENGVKKTSPEIGAVVQDGFGSSQFRFSQITDPVEIASFDQLDENIEADVFKFNQDKSILYIFIDTFFEETLNYEVKQELYSISMSDFTKKLIWSHNIGNSKYPKMGPAQIAMIEEDKYIVLYLGICYGCEAFEPHGSLLINIDTGNEIYLGETGDFRFDLNKANVTYKQLKGFEEKCEPGYGCDSGVRTVYKPGGIEETTKLP